MLVRFSVEMVFALTKQSCLSAAAAATATAEPEAAPAPKFVAFTALKEQRRQQQAAAAPEPEPEPEPGLQQPVALCKFWARGGCSRGERCHFRHEYRDITEQQRTEIATHTLRQRAPLSALPTLAPTPSKAVIRLLMGRDTLSSRAGSWTPLGCRRCAPGKGRK